MHDNSIFVGPAELQVAMSTASQIVKRPFLRCSKPLLQSKATGKCTSIEMRIIFIPKHIKLIFTRMVLHKALFSVKNSEMAYWYKNSIKLTKACIVLNILYRTPRLINITCIPYQSSKLLSWPSKTMPDL